MTKRIIGSWRSKRVRGWISLWSCLFLGTALHVCSAQTFLHSWLTKTNSVDVPFGARVGAVHASAAGADGSLFVTGVAKESIRSIPRRESIQALQEVDGSYIARVRPSGIWDDRVVRLSDIRDTVDDQGKRLGANVLFKRSVVINAMVAGDKGSRSLFVCGYSIRQLRATAFVSKINLNTDLSIGSIGWVQEFASDEDRGETAGTAIDFNPTRGLLVGLTVSQSIRNVSGLNTARFADQTHSALAQVSLQDPNKPKTLGWVEIGFNEKQGGVEVRDVKMSGNGDAYAAFVSKPASGATQTFTDAIVVYNDPAGSEPTSIYGTQNKAKSFDGAQWNQAAIPMTFVMNFTTAPRGTAGVYIVPLGMIHGANSTSGSRTGNESVRLRMDKDQLYLMRGKLSDAESLLIVETLNPVDLSAQAGLSASFGSDSRKVDSAGMVIDASGRIIVAASVGRGTCGFINGQGEKQAPTIGFDSRRVILATLGQDRKWMLSSIQRNANTSPDVLDPPEIALGNTDYGQVLWMAGGYRSETASGIKTIEFGDEISRSTSVSCEPYEHGGYVVALEPPNWTFRKQVELTLESGQVHGVRPSLGTVSVFAGARVDIQVPSRVYANEEEKATPKVLDNLDDSIEGELAGFTRRSTSLGFTVIGRTSNSVSEHANATHFSFVVTENTVIRANWLEEFLLDVSATEPSNVLKGPTLGGFGDPSPTIGPKWIPKDSEVSPSILGTVFSPVASEDGARFQIASYTLKRATWKEPRIVTVDPSLGRIQVGMEDANSTFQPYILMSEPMKLNYAWKKQYRVQVSTSSRATETLPFILDDQGKDANSGGVGEFWFDANSTISVGCTENGGEGEELIGWMNAQWPIGTLDEKEKAKYPVNSSDLATINKGPLDTLMEALDRNKVKSWKKTLLLTGPVRVTWRFGDKIYYSTVTIGDGINLKEVKDGGGVLVNEGDGIEGMVDLNAAPTLRIIQSPPGSTPDDMQVWDAVGRIAYPLRPGVYFADWKRLDAPNGKPVVVQVTAKFPSRSHFRHISQTPPVELNPSERSSSRFLGLKYVKDSEATVNGSQFSATHAGRAVLLFSLANGDSVARGDLTKETLQVRVVQSRAWNEKNPPEWGVGTDGAARGAAATIGRRITSERDTARLLKGYIPKAGLEKNLAPYNVGLYGDGSKPGPIFPVNRWWESLTEFDPDKSLVVVWYERREGMLWPYQPEYFNRFEWPSESRIVIASRLGSEGVDANGEAQVSFDSARFEQVSVYNQPDSTKPGYNPNEEHAFVAPSFAYADSPKPPPTVFALRNDLNIHETLIVGKNALKTEYTSEPYVLAQYRETATGEWGMKAYKVETEDPTVSGDIDGNSIDGTLRIPVVVSGLAGTIQDISIELDLDNHRQVGAEQRILLEAPIEGSLTLASVALAEGISNQGKYEGTIFTDSATLTLEEKTPPFKGRVLPTHSILEKLATATNGNWTLIVRNPSLNPIVADVNVSIVVTTDVGGGSGLIVQRFGQGDWNRVHFPYVFRYPAKVGQPIVPPYPLNLIMGAVNTADTQRQNRLDQLTGGSAEPDAPVQVATTYVRGNSGQCVHHVDHRGQGWVVSGNGRLGARYYYPLRADFWYPSENQLGKAGAVIGKAAKVGDLIPWLPRNTDLPPEVATPYGIYTGKNDIRPAATDGETLVEAQARMATTIATRPVAVAYDTEWPVEIPVLKVGETLTFSGGEFHSDFPSAPGLPGVLGWSAGRIVYDSQNPAMNASSFTDSRATLSRLAAPLSVRSVDLALADFPPELLPAGKRSHVKGTHYVFDALPASLQRRFFYDFVAGQLAVQGLVADRTAGDPDLTAAPPPLVVLEPNILTTTEIDALKKLGQDSVKRDAWTTAVDKMFKLSRDPALVEAGEGAPYRIGLEPGDGEGANSPALATVRGPGLALLANQALLDPKYEWKLRRPDAKTGDPIGYGYITLVENDDPTLGAAPVTVHVIKIQQNERYRGAIKTILSDNVFDEKITLRHSGDFGAEADNLIFEWWMREEDGTERPLPTTTTPDPWSLFGKSGTGLYQVDLTGTGGVIIRDNLFFVRYRHVNDADPGDIKWLKTDWKKYGAPWAGAANPPDIEGHFRPQLVQGWVKRVLDAVNPYEARIRDLQNNTSPAAYASMIQQFGGRYEGDVALNPDKGVIENVGLIELYQTILNRAENLTINLSQPDASVGIDKALMLAGTRLADFYTILGNESYADALDPTIGFGTHPDFVNYGSLAPTIHAFQNQVGSLLEEELVLLRGQDDTMGRPVYNRLMWNFTKGEGEAAYALNYNIADANHDGFLDEADGQRLYPQGHGDAWGHYLTATTLYYDLLKHPSFNWRSQSELYSLQDVVFKVDYLDERKFALAAAAKAKVGADIVNQTYRARYVTEPDGQWQGYKDSNPERAWGVTEWARRAGQGALFDWIMVNALLPSRDTNEAHNALQKIDRTTVTDLAQISANLGTIQSTYDDSNIGLNPLGLDNDVVTFDLDPTFNFVGSTAQIGRTAVQGMTHFKQIYERALKTLNNAKTAFDEADRYKSDLRAVGNVVDALRQDAVDHDLDYRNRLIEVFGTPYQGQIGPGKAYPEGYEGPDLLLFMYADTTSVSRNTIPKVPSGFVASIQGFEQFVSNETDNDGNGIGLSGTPTGPVDVNFKRVLGEFFLQDTSTKMANPELYSTSTLNLPLQDSASSYSFQAPTDWGKRASMGELQSTISEMIQKESDIAFAISNYEAYLTKIGEMIQAIQAFHNFAQEDHDVRSELRNELLRLTITSEVLKSVSQTTMFAANLVKDVTEAVVEGFDVTVGTANTPWKTMAVPISVANDTAQFFARIGAFTFEQAASKLDASKDDIGHVAEIKLEDNAASYELRQRVLELNQELRNESTQRIGIFRLQQELQQIVGQYRAKLQEGLRLLEERRNWNIRVATATQQNRYQDYVFRAARSSALEKYRASFNLAARYVYLAAKAYDFETNLSPNHRASPQSILDQIMQARTLGQLVDFEPISGQGGLADAMATLRDHFAVLEGQMGFNNPQLENQYISMRNGLFRIGSTEDFDPVYRTGNQTYADWQASEAIRLGYTNLATYAAAKESLDGKFRHELKKYRVADLWNVPEFRRYCRPFTAPANGAQPGLVIPFGSQVIAGRNFFGRDLAGGDVAFDSTLFATKIFGAGVWFKGYDKGANAATPRVYLVPVGLDVMTIPDSPVLETRVWRAVDQSIPVPFVTSRNHLRNPDWIPVRDSLMEPMGQPRRFPSFLAATTDPGSGEPPDFSDMARITTRLIGRSVWNTEWLMIIPGLAMNADADAGLDTFLESIEDIQLYFSTYGYSGN